MKEEMNDIIVVSSLDHSQEENLFYFPEGQKNVPLLVGLHSWSFGRFNQVNNMLPYCKEHNWALLLPEFRGPNTESNPRAIQACGSTLAKQDIVDAVSFVKENYDIDAGKIMLLGGSGGGHMALMMAAYAPSLWTAVSSWCPITDIKAWHQQNRYVPHIEASTGGVPGESPEIDKQYFEKSPINFAEDIAKANLFVHHGRHDKSVHYSHTMKLIQEVEKYNPQRFFFEIFDGGHELVHEQAFPWLSAQIGKNAAESTVITG